MRAGLRFPILAGLLMVLGCGEPPPPETPASASHVDIPSVKPTASATAVALPDPVLPPLPARPPCDVAAGLRNEADEVLAKGRAYRAARAAERADKICPTTVPASWKTRLAALSKLGRDDAARALAGEIAAAPSADAAALAAARAELAKAPAPAASSAPAASAPAPAKKPAAPPAKGAGASKDAAAKVAPPSTSAGEKLLDAALTAHHAGAPDAREQLDRALVRLEQESSEAPAAFFDVGPREALAISANGAVAVIGAGNTAILIETRDLQPRRFFDHEGPVKGAALSPDGKRLATVAKGDVKVWSAETGKLVRTLSWAREDVVRAVFSADGKRIVTAAGNPFDALVRVWDAETGDSIESFSITGTFEPTALAMSRDGKLVAVGTKLGIVELWALDPLKKIARLADEKSFMESTTSIDFSPKGDKVAVASGSGKVGVWETKQGKPSVQVTTEGHGSTGAVLFSPDGSRLLASAKVGFEAVIREWDTASGTILQNKPAPIEVDLFSRDAKVGVTAGRDGVGVLDMTARTAVTRQSAGVRLRSIHFGPARVLAATPSFDKGLLLVTPRGIRSFETDRFQEPLAVSLDGRALAQADYRTVRAWDVDTGAQLPGYPQTEGSLGPIAFAPEGRQVRAASVASEVVSVLGASPGDGAWKELLREKRKGVRKLVLAAHGRFGLLTEDKRAFVLDLTSGQTRALEDTGLDERIQAVAISGDGAAAFVMRDRALSRFDTRTGKRTHGPVAMDCYSSDVVVSFDGARAAASCSREIVTLSFAPGGEVETGARLRPGDMVYDTLTMAPHGDLIATGHDGGYVRFWTRAGEQRGDVHWLGGDAALVRAPDGRVLPLGREAAKVESRLFCRVGTKALPFVVCADALRDEGLLQEVLAPAP